MAALKAVVIDATGKSIGDRELAEELFGGPVNTAVMHQVMTAQLAAARAGTASTKTRSEVRGGGRKPWRQKGTGRARHGSSRSPIWTGGGTVFGPKPRKYTQRIPKKMRRAALRSALADKARGGGVWILDGFNEARTRSAAAALRTAGIEGRVLIVLDPDERNSEMVDRAFRNLDRAAFALYGALSTYDVLVADALVFTTGAFDNFVRSGQHTERVSRDDLIVEGKAESKEEAGR